MWKIKTDFGMVSSTHYLLKINNYCLNMGSVTVSYNLVKCVACSVLLWLQFYLSLSPEMFIFDVTLSG